MPFPFVYRVPQSISDETLLDLRITLVQITSDLMKCNKEWVGPEFFRSTLKDPADLKEGCSTVLIKLETGLFDGRENDDPQVKEVLQALTDAVWEAFNGMYEVEASVAGWHPGWKCLREAK
ncbi:hypothetical protein A2572_03250 [Candidatus Collierbacteria bacterium RIFOXYD1_FULL_40_9]|uniref:Uncharacterized protein n=1 Tax=Candidatus Collierbacteria bacterium RIFOXYD1_FULL_40_9 TaxID=1817731 RepID=A0A1F5FWW6_9BACT|nr:MAG: hypothetical protein A2572_03250 [Candidatus Collierbacteria bacterium RIFOXYD1_FULL_40_9]